MRHHDHVGDTQVTNVLPARTRRPGTSMHRARRTERHDDPVPARPHHACAPSRSRPRRFRRRGAAVFAAAALAALPLTGCGHLTDASGNEPFTLPVGPTRWDATAPSWFHDGVLHVGDHTVRLGEDVEKYVLGATGAYWMRGQTLMFTSADGDTQRVHDVGWGNLAVSADRTVLATVDQSRGPVDDYGTHVMQLAVFDTRTGEQLYRTPDADPPDGADLADLYSETMPLLQGVSTTQAFYDHATIDLAEGTETPTVTDPEGGEVFVGYAKTLLTDGYPVALREQGRRRVLADSEVWGTGRLSPDRTTLFDTGMWPARAVAYDAATGAPRPIQAPWGHFTLAGFTDPDTIFGVAEQIDPDHPVNVLRARQVVSCDLPALTCSPLSSVLSIRPLQADDGPGFLTEGSAVAL